MTSLDGWVDAHRYLVASSNYSTGWWDHIESLYRLREKYGLVAEVVAEYDMETPPPTEALLMPLVRLGAADAVFLVACYFGQLRPYIVSVERQQDYALQVAGLFEETDNLLVGERPSGFGPDMLYGSYHRERKRFSCSLRDLWDVDTLLRLVLGSDAWGC